jgi:nitroreductase
MELLSLLNWRYAAKRMTGEKLPQEKLDNILESIRLSASSIGFQPYNIIVIEDKELQEKIKPIAFGQPQITEASHLLIFAAWQNISLEQIDNYIDQIVKIRNVSPESLSTIKDYLLNMVNNSEEQNFNWAARQAYIALGTGLIAAAAEKIDATPMEGFNPADLDQLLGLKEQGLRSLAILALGYRDTENDWLLPMTKVRTEKDKLFIPYTTEKLAQTA